MIHFVFQDHFKKYYDAVMPYLKAILMNATDKSNRMLRAKSMECISLVGMAVGKDKFRDDAKQVSICWTVIYILLEFLLDIILLEWLYFPPRLTFRVYLIICRSWKCLWLCKELQWKQMIR